MTEQNLDSVFEDKPTEEKEAAQVAAPADESKAEETEEKNVEVEPAATTAEKDEGEAQEWTKQAALDERRKRQALEKEIAELKQKMNGNAEAEEPLEHDSKESEWRIVTSISQRLMRKQHADYDDMEKVFVSLAEKNPILRQKLRESDFPAEYAYQTAKDHIEFEEFQKTKEEFAEFKKSKASQPKEDPKKASAVKVPDLTKVTAKGRNTDDVEEKPTLEKALEGAPF